MHGKYDPETLQKLRLIYGPAFIRYLSRLGKLNYGALARALLIMAAPPLAIAGAFGVFDLIFTLNFVDFGESSSVYLLTFAPALIFTLILLYNWLDIVVIRVLFWPYNTIRVMWLTRQLNETLDKVGLQEAGKPVVIRSAFGDKFVISTPIRNYYGYFHTGFYSTLCGKSEFQISRVVTPSDLIFKWILPTIFAPIYIPLIFVKTYVPKIKLSKIPLLGKLLDLYIAPSFTSAGVATPRLHKTSSDGEESKLIDFPLWYDGLGGQTFKAEDIYSNVPFALKPNKFNPWIYPKDFTKDMNVFAETKNDVIRTHHRFREFMKRKRRTNTRFVAWVLIWFGSQTVVAVIYWQHFFGWTQTL
ncbi:hypothetical protein [Maricaulis sp.]|uniref:hypothetical protein n=1 Tax=Maricaulis sp. TaxID=1486257 RepID=UPI003A8D2DF9